MQDNASDAFREFSPVVSLGQIIYFAYCANRLDEMKRWGEELKPWIAQSPRSPYVVWIHQAYSHSCPYIWELIR